MPLLLRSRAVTRSPIPLLSSAEGAARGIRLPSAGYVRVRHGVYADAAAMATLAPWQRYAARVHAFLMTHPGAILCLESAAVIHGIPLFGECRDIHVYDPMRAASRRFGDVCVHTSDTVRGVVEVDDAAVTTLADTIVDLIRVVPPAEALAAADAALSPAQGGTASLDALRELASARVDRRGRRQVDWVLNRADARSESPGESVSRAVIEWSGFETPALQPVFHYEGVEDRTDFLFPSTRTLGESDGWGKYDLHDATAAERHLRDEKRREDRLRRHGHPFARWELTDVWRVDPLCRALALASVRLVRVADRARLGSLRYRPRQVAHGEKPSGR